MPDVVASLCGGCVYTGKGALFVHSQKIHHFYHGDNVGTLARLLHKLTWFFTSLLVLYINLFLAFYTHYSQALLLKKLSK